MEAEVIALAHSCRELSPLWTWFFCWEQIGLPLNKAAMHVSIHEDNAKALVLAETLTSQPTPRSKNYVIKPIWFPEQIVFRGIRLLKIHTMEQLGDIFPKGLPTEQPMSI